MAAFRQRLPAILSDIDGVLYRGGKVIQGSQWAVERLLKPFSMPNGEKACLPFTLLTNGGGNTEKARVDLVNQRVFGRTAPLNSNDLLLDESQMIC